nr:hypothetical protein [Tanacetum cinerariifolium]
MSLENKAHYESEKEAIHLLLTRIGMKSTQLLMLARQLMKCGYLLKGYNKSKLIGLEDTNEEIDEQELEEHYVFMAKIQETGFERYKALNDRTTDYDKLEPTKGPTFDGRPTFENLMYLKMVQSKKPCLYEITNDQSDPANRLVPDREETMTLEKESRSKLNKDLVRPYDYTKLNSLYEILKQASHEYLEQLAHANEVRKKMWRKSFVKFKPNIFKNIGFLPVLKSIIKSRQAYNVITNNINHFRELVDQAWEKHSHNHFRALTALDMKVLIKTCLMPLAIKTHNDSFTFLHELKQEMHVDLKYVESYENKIDELKSDKAEFSNMYDIRLQEFCKEKASNVFQKEREQYFEIQDLKAQLQDKNIAISELKKLIEKCKGKPLLRSTQMKHKAVTNNSQVKDKKTEVEDHPRISSISNQTKSVTMCNDSLKSITLNVNDVYATCRKCLVDSDHFACVTKLLNDVNARTKRPNVVPISTRKPKGHANKSVATPPMKIVASESTIQKSKNYYSMLYEKTNLEVAFWKSTCFVRDLQGNDLLIEGCRDWFTKLKYVKDQLCSSCEVSKEKRSSFKTKAVPSLKGRLNLLHIDLCGPMRVASINKKKYILVIVDDYSRYTWTLFLRDGENLDKMREKRDPCILMGYFTQSKGYRVYNKRTRLIVESIHLRFVEIKEMTETSVANDTSGLTQQLHHNKSWIFYSVLCTRFFTVEPTTPTTNVHAEDNKDNQVKDTQVQQDKCINPFCTLVREITESSSRNIDNLNMHSFYQPYDSEYRWTKGHPLKKVRGNPSKPVKTRRQLATVPEMCMFSITVSTAKPKTIKEAMADFAWIEAMQENFHQFDRL